jgi:hydroxyethylthiazole kinase-like uncharacterized protein yjeF
MDTPLERTNENPLNTPVAASSRALKLIGNLAQIDRQAMAGKGLTAPIPGHLLMHEAGRQVAEQVRQQLNARGIPLSRAKVTILCGPGNNGGDGLVCARFCTQFLPHVTVVLTHPPERYQGDAMLAWQWLQDVHGWTSVRLDDVAHAACPGWVNAVWDGDVVVDAAYGSGLSRGLDSNLALVFEHLNALEADKRPVVVAVDVPTGVNSESGDVQGTSTGAALRADVTVTFSVPKPGLYLQPGKTYAGQIVLADIGIPATLVDDAPSALRLMTADMVQQALPKRDHDVHKYQAGHVLVIGGSRHMPGAATLAAEAALAALRSGAGLVTLAAPESVFAGGFAQAPLPPEIMRLPLPEDADGLVNESSWAPLAQTLCPPLGRASKFDAVVCGPGLGRSAGVNAFIEQLTAWGQTATTPVVMDADGLYALAALQKKKLPAYWIITPHVGEWCQLLGLEKDAVLQALPQSALAGAKDLGTVVVLKSATTVVASLVPDGSGEPTGWLSPLGHSGMATAGCGDVLAGMIGGFLGQYPATQPTRAVQAAMVGVALHGLAGDRCKAIAGQGRGLIASDIMRALPEAIEALECFEAARYHRLDWPRQRLILAAHPLMALES